MAYDKTIWDETVAITPARLNNLETQYEKAVENAPQVASEIDAMSGVNNTKYMTPLRTKQSIIEHAAVVRGDSGKPLVVEKRTNDPTNPEVGRMWLRSDL